MRTTSVTAALVALAVAVTAARAQGPDVDDLDSYISTAKDATETKANRLNALKAIARLGPKARKAGPSLVKCLEEKKEVGAAAARALGAIGPAVKDVAADALRAHLRALEDPVFQGVVAAALGRVCPRDKKTVQLLDRLLARALVSGGKTLEDQPLAPKRPYMDLMRAVVGALAQAGGDAGPAVPNIYKVATCGMRVKIADDDYLAHPLEVIYGRKATLKELRPYRLAVVQVLRAVGTAKAREYLGRIKTNHTALRADASDEDKDVEVKAAAAKALAELKRDAGKSE